MSDQDDLERAVALISAAYANGKIDALELAAEMERIGRIARAACDDSDGFVVSGDRLFGELGERQEQASRLISYHNVFLDDCLRGISPHDLILVGAESGAGKTDFVTAVARENAKRGRHVYYLALEAEPREIERRIKYAILVEHAQRYGVPMTDVNFPDWYLGNCEDILGRYNADADAFIAEKLSTLHTLYRGSSFTDTDLRRIFLSIQDQADLVILDHLHYVDVDDDNENRGQKRLVQLVRDLVLGAGKPVILVAHLRKKDRGARFLVPSLDDFHGSSDIAKVCTRAILLTPARDIPARVPSVANTFITVPKDRVGGANGLIALQEYSYNYRSYGNAYRLGRPGKGGEWSEIDPSNRPRWAKRCR